MSQQLCFVGGDMLEYFADKLESRRDEEDNMHMMEADDQDISLIMESSPEEPDVDEDHMAYNFWYIHDHQHGKKL